MYNSTCGLGEKQKTKTGEEKSRGKFFFLMRNLLIRFVTIFKAQY